MEFYALVLRKKINIPEKNIKEVIRKGRRFAVGTYKAKGKEYEAWRVLGLAGKAKKKKWWFQKRKLIISHIPTPNIAGAVIIMLVKVYVIKLKELFILLAPASFGSDIEVSKLKKIGCYPPGGDKNAIKSKTF